MNLSEAGIAAAMQASLESGVRPPYAPSARARGFRDFLSGYAGGPKHRPGPYDRPEDPFAPAAGPPMPGGAAGGGRAVPGTADDPTMEALVSRTLYICKLPTDCSEEKLKELAEPFGDIRKITVYPSKQIAFLEYWDIRCSEKARASLKSATIGGRKIDCQFSHARNDRVRDGNTGTLYVRPVTSDRSFVDPNTLEQYHSFFAAYGEIKKVSSNRKREAEKFVEYYDLRSAEAALNALNGKDLGGVSLEIQFANHSSKTISNQDSRLTGERKRYAYDDGGGYYGPRGGGGAGYGPPPGAMMGRVPHPYAAAMPGPPPGAAPIDPYGYAPPPMMGVDPYWSYMWASQAAAAAAAQQSPAAMARGPPGGGGRAPNPYRS